MLDAGRPIRIGRPASSICTAFLSYSTKYR
jgi:hypothetical protein